MAMKMLKAFRQRGVSLIWQVNYPSLVLSLLKGNYSGMLIGRLIAIRYFLARKITAECAEERKSSWSFILPSRTRRLNSRFGSGCAPGSSSADIAKSHGGVFRCLSSYRKTYVRLLTPKTHPPNHFCGARTDAMIASLIRSIARTTSPPASNGACPSMSACIRASLCGISPITSIPSRSRCARIASRL